VIAFPAASVAGHQYCIAIRSAIIEEIERMREAKSALMAYYYFDFKDNARHGLLCSIFVTYPTVAGCPFDAT
jgi:hypothetical protein